MHLLTCLVCGIRTDSGPNIAGKLRPLCVTCFDRWGVSDENLRGFGGKVGGRFFRPAPGGGVRAFMDWLTRRQAERRNARAA
jgi:hypothetical protein